MSTTHPAAVARTETIRRVLRRRWALRTFPLRAAETCTAPRRLCVLLPNTVYTRGHRHDKSGSSWRSRGDPAGRADARAGHVRRATRHRADAGKALVVGSARRVSRPHADRLPSFGNGKTWACPINSGADGWKIQGPTARCIGPRISPWTQRRPCRAVQGHVQVCARSSVRSRSSPAPRSCCSRSQGVGSGGSALGVGRGGSAARPVGMVIHSWSCERGTPTVWPPR